MEATMERQPPCTSETYKGFLGSNRINMTFNLPVQAYKLFYDVLVGGFVFFFLFRIAVFSFAVFSVQFQFARSPGKWKGIC